MKSENMFPVKTSARAARSCIQHRKPTVEGEGTLGALHRLHDAVAEAAELLLAGADVRCKAGTRVVQRVHDRQRARASEAARGELRSKKLPELCVFIVLGELLLDRVLEREVEGLSGKVAAWSLCLFVW